MGRPDRGAALLWKWTDPNFRGLIKSVLSPCGTPDRVVFHFDPYRSDTSGSGWENDLHTVIGLIRDKHPNVERIDLVLIVGSVDDAGTYQVCLSPIDGTTIVRASETHSRHTGWADPSTYDAAMDRVPRVAAQYVDVVMGPDLHVPCSYFADTNGHFTTDGIALVGKQMADWYGYVPAPAGS